MQAIETKIGFIPAAEDLRGMEGRAVALNGEHSQYPNGLWQLPRPLEPRGVISKGCKMLEAPSVTIIGVCNLKLSGTTPTVKPGDPLTPDEFGYFYLGGTFATSLGYGASGSMVPALILPSGTSQKALTQEEIGTDDTSFETKGYSFIVCRNTSQVIITLRSNPQDGELCVITRKGSGVVRIEGVINGRQSFNLLELNDTAQLKYSELINEWSVI